MMVFSAGYQSGYRKRAVCFPAVRLERRILFGAEAFQPLCRFENIAFALRAFSEYRIEHGTKFIFGGAQNVFWHARRLRHVYNALAAVYVRNLRVGTYAECQYGRASAHIDLLSFAGNPHLQAICDLFAVFRYFHIAVGEVGRGVGKIERKCLFRFEYPGPFAPVKEHGL